MSVDDLQGFTNPVLVPKKPGILSCLAWLWIAAACGTEASDSTRDDPHAWTERTCVKTVEIEDAALRNAAEVLITSEFNQFSPQPMTREEHRWILPITLAPGSYAYELTIDGALEETPPEDVLTTWRGDRHYRRLDIPSCAAPAISVTSLDASPEGLIKGRLRFVRAADGPGIDPTSLSISLGPRSIQGQVDEHTGDISFQYAAPNPGKYSLRVEAQDRDGTPTESGTTWIPFWVEEVAFDWRKSLMYMVFVDRFRDSDNSGLVIEPDVTPIASYNGGDFRGTQDAIAEGYFDRLGVDVLWLTPTYDNVGGGFLGIEGDHLYTGYHGYWPVDPLVAEDAFGGDDALIGLIDVAHRHGIRVLFDLVLNHVHQDHVYCTEHPDWCKPTCTCGASGCPWDGPESRALDCQFTPYLIDLNFRDHQIVDRVVDDVLALVRKFDVDGLRIDAAKHIDPVIIETIRHRLERIEDQGGATFYLVGETFTDDRDLISKYISPQRLDGQFDFPLMFAIREVFGGGASFSLLEDAAQASQNAYGAHYQWMSPFLGNHDVARFATAIAGNAQGPFENTPDLLGDPSGQDVTEPELLKRIEMAFAFVLTQPGIPLIYYGDEIGLAGAGDPDNRRPMPQALNGNRLALLSFIERVNTLRRASPALQLGERNQLYVDQDLYVYARFGTEGTIAIVALYKGNQTRTETITVPNALGLAGRTLRDRLAEGGREYTVADGRLTLEMEPWQSMILSP
jgi:glycosidase